MTPEAKARKTIDALVGQRHIVAKVACRLSIGREVEVDVILKCELARRQATLVKKFMQGAIHERS